MDSKYICHNCGYCTNIKSHFIRHQEKKNACNPEKIHAKIKESIDIQDIPKIETKNEESNDQELICHICKLKFSRSDNLKRHMKSDSHKHNVTVYNDHRRITNINGNPNNVNIDMGDDNKFHFHFDGPTQIHKFTHFDINDLSLFEQYMILTYSVYPEKTSFDMLMTYLNFNPGKPEYHNIKYPNIRKNTMNVYDGEKWVTNCTDDMKHIVSSQRPVLCMIYNKFRMFLGRRANIHNIEHLYNGLQCSKKHAALLRSMKHHIYNNRNMQKLKVTDQNIPTGDDDNEGLWFSLSKSFEWDEVVQYINKMEEIKINFNDDLYEIRESLRFYSKNKKDKFFDKLIRKLNVIIHYYDTEFEAHSSSQSDEINKFENYGKTEIDKKVREEEARNERRPKHEISKIIDQQSIPKDDHKQMATKVSYVGSQRIGESYLSKKDKDRKKS